MIPSCDIEAALATAEAVCLQKKARLTPFRRAVLKQLLAAGKPLGAYELLQRLGPGKAAAKLAPPMVYRSLDFLLEHGLIHKLETARTYVACMHPEHPHAAQFLICRRCGTVVETGDTQLAGAAEALGQRAGVVLQQQAVELTGVCASRRGCGVCER